MTNYDDLEKRVEILEKLYNCKNLEKQIYLLEKEVKHIKAVLQYQKNNKK